MTAGGTAVEGSADRVTKAAFLFFRFEKKRVVDVQRLLRGAAGLSTRDRLWAASPLSGTEHPITDGELRILREIPTGRWVVAAEVTRRLGIGVEAIASLVEKGLLLSAAGHPRAAEMERHHQRLTAARWQPHAALYHFLGRWRDVDSHPEAESLRRRVPERFDRDDYARPAPAAAPPPHFFRAPRAHGAVTLPGGDKTGPLYELLRRRRTTRLFDRSRPMTLEDLAAVLRWVYGCHGTERLSDDLVVLKKTSPSGGGLHPVEAYPLIRDVEGLAPGLYHYDVGSHALEVLREMEAGEVEELAVELTAGQDYFATAHVLFLLTARFARNFWKYRRHKKAYKVLLMDTAHLSQTLFLVAADLGLGAFFTAAVNDVNIEEALGLDPFEQGVMGISGCGVPLAAGGAEDDLALHPEPWEPGTEA